MLSFKEQNILTAVGYQKFLLDGQKLTVHLTGFLIYSTKMR